MRRIIQAGVVIGIATFLAGCIQTKDEYTLNPDGSGKVVHESTMQSGMNFDLGDSGAAASPSATLTNTIHHELEQAQGVDAWKDISFSLASDGRMQFKATAYFRDLNKLKFSNGGFQSEAYNPGLKKDDKGGLVLTLSDASAKKKAAAKPAAPVAAADITAKITEEKAQYQQMKPMLIMMLGTLKRERTFHLPGAVTQATNFKHGTGDTLTLTEDGQKMLEIVDSLTTDDKWWQDQVKNGKNLQQDNPFEDMKDTTLNQKLFGEVGPVQAMVAAPLKSLFDYATEVAAAKQNYPAHLKAIGLGASAAAPMAASVAPGAGFKSLTVSGVRLIRLSDSKRDLRPFNDNAGFSLSVVGEFPGAMMQVTEGRVESATADTDEDLLPSGQWEQKIHFPRLSKDRTAVIFEVNLTQPGDKVKGLKEVTGTLDCLTAEGTKNVDLGMTAFTVGTAGKELGARIEKLEDSKYEKGKQTLSLKLIVANYMVKSVTFYNTDGSEIPTASAGSTWSGENNTTLNYSTAGAFPATGKIVVELHDKMQKFQLPFKLTNLTLFGTPMP